MSFFAFNCLYQLLTLKKSDILSTFFLSWSLWPICANECSWLFLAPWHYAPEWSWMVVVLCADGSSCSHNEPWAWCQDVKHSCFFVRAFGLLWVWLMSNHEHSWGLWVPWYHIHECSGGLLRPILARSSHPLKICRWFPQIVFILLNRVRPINVGFSNRFFVYEIYTAQNWVFKKWNISSTKAWIFTKFKT